MLMHRERERERDSFMDYGILLLYNEQHSLSIIHYPLYPYDTECDVEISGFNVKKCLVSESRNFSLCSANRQQDTAGGQYSVGPLDRWTVATSHLGLNPNWTNLGHPW
jgi:hypothetical protein